MGGLPGHRYKKNKFVYKFTPNTANLIWKNFFSLFAYFSSPCMCGKLSELLVKYPLSCGQPNYEFLQHFLLWVGLIDDVDMTVARGFYCNSVVWPQLKGKLWWLLG